LRKKEPLITISLVILYFLILELITRLELVSSLIFPSPTIVFNDFLKGFQYGEYGHHLIITTLRLVFGFILGGGTGLIFGLVLGWSTRLRKILDPIISAIHPIPKFALLPIIIVAFGIGESSRIIMVSISAFFPILINTIGGVLQINPVYYHVVQNYGGNKYDVFKKVVIPGSLPFILTGARLSLRSSLTISIAIEMIFGNEGLGRLIYRAWNSLNMPGVYSILIIISILGVGSNLFLNKAKKHLVPWHQENNQTS
jgi:ABC-type nitrate/sulfonate/bicarbonate transport system permease component